MNDVLIIIFTGVVAVSTVLYMLITGWLALETRRMRQAQTEPRVSIQLELNNQLGNGGLELMIRNEGLGPAQDVRFEFQGDPGYFIKNGIGRPINEVPVIKDGLRYLGPGRQFNFILGWLHGEAFQRANEEPWTFHVSYKNLSGKQQKDTYVLDFSQFSHLIIGGGEPLRKIERHLHSLKNDVRHLTTGFHKPQVITQTKEEYRKESEQIRQSKMGVSAEDFEYGSEHSSQETPE